jgi:hypothetical protein
MKTRFALVLIFVPCIASGQIKFPPKDDSKKSPELQLFIAQLKEIIQNKDSKRLLERVHPQIKFDFDDGVGVKQFKEKWKPEDKASTLWPVIERIVELGGVFTKSRTDPFYAFVFPYVNEVELEDPDQYVNSLVVTGKNVTVREKPDLSSKAVGQLTYDVVTFDYKKSEYDKWYFVQTSDKKISGYVNSDFVYSPVDYRMFLTNENGRWQISCLVAGD